MVSSINQRLKQILKYKKLTQEELRKMLVLKNKQQISNWINNKENIPDKHILKIISSFPDINANWFITGKGEMLKKYQEVRIQTNSENTSTFEPDEEYYPNTDSNTTCKKCIEYAGIIKFLQLQLKNKDQTIGELQQKIGALEVQLKKEKTSTKSNT